MISDDDFWTEEWVCKNNFIVNVINVVSFTFIDLIPIFVIFYLHWQNFRKEAEKEYMLEKQLSGVSTKGNKSNPNSLKSSVTKDASFVVQQSSESNQVEGGWAADADDM